MTDALREALDAVGLPETATLDDLIRHHRANAKLEGVFEQLAATPPVGAEPRTAAGRMLLDTYGWNWREHVLAIEAEAATPPASAERDAVGVCPECGKTHVLPTDDIR